jgi:hypothetical protein
MPREERLVPAIVRTALIATLAVAGALGGACAKKPPAPAPEPPVALEVPVPPPRVLAPVAPPELPAAPVEEAATGPARPARPRTPPRPAPTGDAKADPKSDAPTGEGVPAEAPKTADSGTPALRTPQTANDTEADRRIGDVLIRARRRLGEIDRNQLSADARGQYDMARRFIDQASDALKVRNYMFAAYLADKADTLAGGLAGR